MEKDRLENFIWFGRHLLNLAHVVHFTEEEDGRITVRMSDPTLNIDSLDGDKGGPVRSLLSTVVEGRMHRVEIPPIPNFDIADSDNAAIENDLKP